LGFGTQFTGAVPVETKSFSVQNMVAQYTSLTIEDRQKYEDERTAQRPFFSLGCWSCLLASTGRVERDMFATGFPAQK
jgi:hypothetical protein